MGEMKDVTLKSLLMGMKGGEGIAFVANGQLGVIDVYSGLLQGCSYSFGDAKNKTLHLELAKVNCALTISRKSLQDEFIAQAIAQNSKDLEHFNSKSLLELAKQAVESQKKMANQTPEEVDAWAKKLAKDSVAAGESEYGPDYGKAPQKIMTALGVPIVMSRKLGLGDILIVAPSYMNQGKMAITLLDDMPDSKNAGLAEYYGGMYKHNLLFKKTEAFKQEYQQDPSPWEADVVSEQGDVLTSEGMKKAFEDTWNQKTKADPVAHAISKAEKLYGEPLINPIEDAALVIPPPPFGEWDCVEAFEETPGGVAKADYYADAQAGSSLVKVWHHKGHVFVCVKYDAKLVTGEGKPVEQDIAAKVDSIIQQESEQKIKDIEQKLKKINQNHPMAKKIQAELLALKMKFQEMKAKPLQVVVKTNSFEHVVNCHGMNCLGITYFDGGVTAVFRFQPGVDKGLTHEFQTDLSKAGYVAYGGKALPPNGPWERVEWTFKTKGHVKVKAEPIQAFLGIKPTIKDIDAADYIKDAFEQANVGVVKVKAAGHSAVATIVIEKEHITPVELLDAKLHAVGWRREGEAIDIETNTNGSKVLQLDLVRVTQAKKISQEEFAKAIGAEPQYQANKMYAAATTATQIGVDFAKPGAELTTFMFQASNGKAIMLKPDGQVVIPEGMTLDEASQKFWDAIATSNPMKGEVNRLIEKLAIMNTLNEDLVKRLVRYEGDPSKPAPEDPRAARFGNIANSL
jgi:hypothetical protein